MTIPMPSLNRAPNGDHFARKVIPADVRDAYAAAYGVRHEERFRHPAAATVPEAKRAWAEWLADIEGRIAALRAAATGRPVTLSHRELHAVSARWYLWFTSQHEDAPGTFEQWQHVSDEMRDVWESGFSGTGDPERSDEEVGRGHRRRIRAKLSELSRLQTFLASEGLTISVETTEVILDGPLRAEFGAAVRRLMKVSRGDYRADIHAADAEQVARLKSASGGKLAGMTAWDAFARWVAERKPADQTVDRWRGVLEHLDEYFERKDVATYTPEDAVAWKDVLVQAGKASSRTINEVWLTAARRIFGWVVEQKKIAANPFAGVKAAGAKVKGSKGEFTEEAISAILGAALALPASGESEQLRGAKRWVPWLCAYTGSRPGEMAQLRGSDVKQHRLGFWTLRITPEAGTVKGSVPRTVVLHEHLVAQGFPAFAEASGNKPLFYVERSPANTADPLKPRRAPYVVVRNKVGEWVRRDVGVTDPAFSPSHSWRHTFKRRAARPPANIEPRLRDAICGHSDSSAKAVYETPTIEDLADAITRFPRYQVGVA